MTRKTELIKKNRKIQWKFTILTAHHTVNVKKKEEIAYCWIHEMGNIVQILTPDWTKIVMEWNASKIKRNQKKKPMEIWMRIYITNIEFKNRIHTLTHTSRDIMKTKPANMWICYANTLSSTILLMNPSITNKKS